MENNNQQRNDFAIETFERVNNLFSDLPDDTSTKKKSKLPLLITLVIVLLLIVCTVVLAFKFDVFESKGKRFLELLTIDQKIFDLFESNNESVAQENFTFKMDFDEILEDLGEEPTGLGKIQLDNVFVSNDKDFSDSLEMSLDGEMDFELDIEIAKTNDIVGVNVPDVTEKFIGIDTSDIEGLLRNLEDLGIKLDLRK